MKQTPLKRSELKRKQTNFSHPRKPINQTSKKGRAEQARHTKLKRELMAELPDKRVCPVCGSPPDFRGLQLIHRINKSQLGPTTRENCFIGCARCHAKRHGLKEV